MPGPPPMNSAAATMLVAKKAIATGMPSIISPTPRPNRSSAAQYHCMQDLLRLPAEAVEEILAPHDEAQELDAHHGERQRDEADHYPARHVERAHVLLVLQEVADRDFEAVPGEDCADRDAHPADDAGEELAWPGLQIHQQDLDVDVSLLAHQPGRAEAGHGEKRVLGEREEVGRAPPAPSSTGPAATAGWRTRARWQSAAGSRASWARASSTSSGS